MTSTPPHQDSACKPPSLNRISGILLFAVWLSGFSALAYEIIWTRILSLTFGTTLPAVSIVAATFMAGLAGGSLYFGKRADQPVSPLRLFALLELGIAVAAFLFPFALKFVTSTYVAMMHSFPEHPALIFVLRLGFSALLILPPTFCMGGTFPVVCRALIQGNIGRIPGTVYAVNTFGAALGALFTGYHLLPVLGVSASVNLAIGFNLATAIIALLLARRASTPAKHFSQEPSQPVLETKNERLYPLFSIAVIGALALALELLWTRLLLLFLGATTFAFSIILGVFLLALALGGAVAARLLSRPEQVPKRFTQVVLVFGISILATAPYYDRLADLFQFAHKLAAPHWTGISLLSFIIVAGVILIPATCSGALLPLAINLLSKQAEQAGRAIGKTVLCNTLGCIVGSLGATFLLIPMFGLQHSFRLVAALALILGTGLFFYLRREFLMGRSVIPLALVGLTLLCMPWQWDQGRLNSGIYIYSYYIKQAGGLDRYLENFKLIDVVEGRDATVAVKQLKSSNSLSLSVNGKVDANSGTDMETQLLLGHLPLLLHQDPRQALVIGLGSGITLGAATGHPIKKFRCVEISEEVIQASSHFKSFNRAALSDPRVDLVHQDARNHLLVSAETYDVIISEPSNPWQAGNANLFTDEFYRLAASRLNQAGIFCQWVPLYDMTAAGISTVFATFQKTFPQNLTFFVPGSSDLILIGSRNPLDFDYATMLQGMRSPQVDNDLSRIGISSPGELIAGYFLFSQQQTTPLAAGAKINTDNSPVLEFSYPNLFTIQPSEHQALLETPVAASAIPISLARLSEIQQTAAIKDLSTAYSRVRDVNKAEYFHNLQSAAEDN